MKVDINLSKKNRQALANLCRRLFSDFKKIKISKRTVTFKRKWYSLSKTSTQVVDLVLLQIPQAINELYEEYNLPAVFEYGDDLASAVEYFSGETEDIIQYLKYQVDDLDMSMALDEQYSAEPSLLKEEDLVCRKESHATRKIFEDSIDYFSRIITNVIDDIITPLKVVHINTESACNSPPIRAPGLAA